MTNFINVEDCFIKTSICWVNDRFQKIKEEYPEKYEPRIKEAVNLKRSGKYVEALNIYYDIMYEDEKLYASILYYMFKVMMCAGSFCAATTILYYSMEINGTTFHTKDPIGRPFSGYTQQYTQFLRIIDSIRAVIESQDGRPLFEFVSSLSGNDNYQYSRSHDEIESEVNSLIELLAYIMSKVTPPDDVDQRQGLTFFM